MIIRRIWWVTEDFAFPLLKFLQCLFCKRWSCDVVLKNETFAISQNRTFLLNRCIDIDDMVAILLCSFFFFFDYWRKPTVNYPSEISPKRTATPWMKAGFSHEFCIFTRFYSGSVCVERYHKGSICNRL